MDVTVGEFQELVSAVIDELPVFFRRKMENVWVAVEERAGPDVLRSQGIRSSRDLLGLYHGYPISTRGRGYTNVLPDRIVLYREPILRLCRGRDDVRRKVRAVLIHELAHHFGFTEDDLAAVDDC